MSPGPLGLVPQETLANGAATRTATQGKVQKLARLMGGAPGLLVFAHLSAGGRRTPPGGRAQSIGSATWLANPSRSETKIGARRLRPSVGRPRKLSRRGAWRQQKPRRAARLRSRRSKPGYLHAIIRWRSVS